MNRRIASLVARRKRLEARSDRLRAELAGEAGALAERLRLADEVVAAARSGFTRLALLGGSLLLVFGPRGRLLTMATRLVVFWPVLRPLIPHIARLWREH
jgi:hypothetical protein